MTARWPQIRAGLIALVIAFGLLDGLPLPEHPPAWNRGFVEAARDVQRVLMWPVRWVSPTLRVSQLWTLYQAPESERWRLWLETRGRDGRWTPLYRSADPEHDEYAEIFESGRVRSVWDVDARQLAQLDAFSDWMMARSLADHPDASAARLRMEKVHLSSEGVTPLGRFAFIHMRERGQP